MNDQRPDQHIDDAALLLHLDGELNDVRAVEHLGRCPDCMASLKRLEVASQTFLEYRDDVLYPEIGVLPPDPRRLRARLESIDSFSMQPMLQRALGLLSKHRSRWIAAGVFAACALLLITVEQPAHLTAAEFLTRAGAVEINQPVSRLVVHQKIRIRQGVEVIQWESYRGGPAHSPLPRPSPYWDRVLTGPIDWEYPLSVDRFATWHGKLAAYDDRISESSTMLTLTTVASSDDAVESASVTVRHSDWHPLSKRVGLRGQPPIEATEVLYEVHEFTPAPRAATPVRESAQAALPRTVDNSLPTTEQIEEAEIRVREILLSMGVGFTAQEPDFTLVSNDRCVRVEVATQSAQRRYEIQQALAAIPLVQAIVLDAEDVARTHQADNEVTVEDLGSDDTRAAIEPLLWPYLINRLGSAQEANRFVYQVLEDGSRIRAAAAQLHQLSLRYSAAAESSLPPRLRDRVDALAAAILEEAASASRRNSRTLGVVMPVSPPAELIRWPWHERSDALFRTVSEYDRIVNRAFTVTHGVGADIASADEIMQRLSSLDRRLTELTQ